MTTTSSSFVVDAHALVWFFLGGKRLGSRANEILTAAEQGAYEIIVPTIVLAEILTISEKRRVAVDVEQMRSRIADHMNFVVTAFDETVWQSMAALPATLELHDRIIAATARVYGATVITRDPAISAVVETIW